LGWKGPYRGKRGGKEGKFVARGEYAFSRETRKGGETGRSFGEKKGL